MEEDIDIERAATADDALEGEEQLYEHFRFAVDAGQEPQRVDKYMCGKMQHASRSRIQKAADAGFVHINGEPARSNTKVRPGDIVTLMLNRPRHDGRTIPQEIPLTIAYEDSALLVVDKPAGLVVHPGVGNYDHTLVNAVAWHMRNVPSFDPDDPDVGLVHRIDKDTSGLLVVAKTPEAKTSLGAQFYNKTTRRTYIALVWGNLNTDEGRIEGNIGRDVHDRLRMAVYPVGSETGKEAVTHYHVVERYGYATLVECRLETGRTHQIRAHMRHIGHPLFGDERYGGCEILRGNRSSTYKAFIHNCLAACPRQALHAHTLGFRHPVTGQQMDFVSPLPADMQALIAKWRSYAAGTTNDTFE